MQDLVLCANGGRKAGKLAGLLTGLGVTAVIQSSSATTVMVVKLSMKQLGEKRRKYTIDHRKFALLNARG